MRAYQIQEWKVNSKREALVIAARVEYERQAALFLHRVIISVLGVVVVVVVVVLGIPVLGEGGVIRVFVRVGLVRSVFVIWFVFVIIMVRSAFVIRVVIVV